MVNKKKSPQILVNKKKSAQIYPKEGAAGDGLCACVCVCEIEHSEHSSFRYMRDRFLFPFFYIKKNGPPQVCKELGWTRGCCKEPGIFGGKMEVQYFDVLLLP